MEFANFLFFVSLFLLSFCPNILQYVIIIWKVNEKFTKK